jgi:hypothetical protein
MSQEVGSCNRDVVSLNFPDNLFSLYTRMSWLKYLEDRLVCCVVLSGFYLKGSSIYVYCVRSGRKADCLLESWDRGFKSHSRQ